MSSEIFAAWLICIGFGCIAVAFHMIASLRMRLLRAEKALDAYGYWNVGKSIDIVSVLVRAA
jgi:hypothetical protein